jgi:hypothetical protein
MTEPNITEILLADLRSGAADYPSELRDIEIALVGRELRRAYALMTRLKESGKWQPSADAEMALEDFWWEYGQ